MLWIYAGINLIESTKLAREELPEGAIDLSKVMTEELPDAVKNIYNHHSSGHIFLGYVDPLLMLHPTDETKLRKGFEKFDMSVVVSNPLILPLSWKNGTSRLRIFETSRDVDRAEVINNGSTPHIQHEVEHGRTPTQTPNKRSTDKGGKKGRPPTRRKQKGQDQEAKP